MAQRHKHADVIIAWANGADVQYRSNTNDCWHDCKNPRWVDHFKYRAKPETFRYRLALFKDSDRTWVVAYSSQQAADIACSAINFVRWLTDWAEVEL